MGSSSDVVKPVAAMVLVQVIFASVNILYKMALSDGMDLRVLVAYRYLFASAFLTPLAYFVERGSLTQNLYISGMKLTSPTFASATTNLIPAVTFVLALIFRYERLAIATSPGQAKVAGTFLGVGGAMLLTFYKGADITPWHSHVNNFVSTGPSVHREFEEATSSHVMGSLLCVSSCVVYALWLILQAKLSKLYPFHYSSTALMSAMSAMQAVAFALCFDRDVAQWRLRLDVRLLSVVYSGVLASGAMLVVLTWCVKRRGPLFASVFTPVVLVVVAVLSSLLLGERLHLGSALGAVLIVMGLYAVLWGKGREMAAGVAKVGELPADDEEDNGDRRVDVAVQLPSTCLPQITIGSDHQTSGPRSEEDRWKQQDQPPSTAR
ncbi:hypothetical protein HU200_054905 [Digitaria exilis]|uniref:WAT1-related protein n=1 Tax=Digitaria exilis TaxID=1010633 RepID=A0A835AP25_9POAL|nr:hypothetical protein HU200_054905 [Digitaria exilis]